MPINRHEVEFTKEGRLHQQQQADAVLNAAAGVTDLLVISHGWNNDIADARGLYNGFFQKFDEMLGENIVPGLAGRTFAAATVFWPSKKFTDEELIPGGGAVALAAAALEEANDDALVNMLDELKRDPNRLGERTEDPKRTQLVEAAKAQLPKLETSKEARREFVQNLRRLVDPTAAHPDDGSREFLDRDPEELFQELNEPVAAPLAVGAGGGAAFGGGAGGAAGLKDVFEGIKGAARRIANFTTYFQMKQRAGTVGTTGVGPLLQQIRQRNPNVRLHLIGHSFGARVVTAAASTLPPNTNAVTMTLLQGAYSHNGMAQNYDGKNNNGFFRTVLADKRISGPVLITHTKNDTAVGIAYPLASRISREKAAALGDENDPYGGIGRNGAQHTPEVDRAHPELLDIGLPYTLKPNKVYNLKADRFIKNHGDIVNHEIACALLTAIKGV